MPGESFEVGDSVVYRGHGVGTIVGTEVQSAGGSELQCFVIVLDGGLRAFIPQTGAGSMLRPLASKKDAKAQLSILREADVQPDDRHFRERAVERAEVMKTGKRIDIVRLLRGLYAAQKPLSRTESDAVRAMEDLVLPEIALVLAIPLDELEKEMRDRYPIAAVRKI